MSKWNPTASPCPALPLGEAPWGTGLWHPLCPRYIWSLQKQYSDQLWYRIFFFFLKFKLF